MIKGIEASIYPHMHNTICTANTLPPYLATLSLPVPHHHTWQLFLYQYHTTIPGNSFSTSTTPPYLATLSLPVPHHHTWQLFLYQYHTTIPGNSFSTSTTPPYLATLSLPVPHHHTWQLFLCCCCQPLKFLGSIRDNLHSYLSGLVS